MVADVKPPSGSPFLWTKNDGMKALGPFNKTLVTDGDGINKAGVILASRYTGQYGYTSFVLSPAMRTTLVSSLNPTMFGQQVTLHAQVNSLVVGAPPDGEKVTITDGNSALATVPLLSGSATFRTSTLKAGTHALQAVYAGDLNYGSSKSSVLEQTVNPYQTAVSLGSNLNPSLYGQAVTWSAMVTTTGGVAPTGNVVFRWSRDGLNYTIGTAALNAAGVATLTRSNLNADPFGEAYPLVAVYVGDAMNPGNTSAVLPQRVLQTKSAASISSSVNPSAPGQVVTLTATITSPTVTPTGPVTFTIGKQVLGTAQIVPWSHKATLAISTLPVGSTVVTATYPGDSNIAKSSASLMQSVQ